MSQTELHLVLLRQKDRCGNGAGIGLGARVATDSVQWAGMQCHQPFGKSDVNLTLGFSQSLADTLVASEGVAVQRGRLGIHKHGTHGQTVEMICGNQEALGCFQNGVVTVSNFKGDDIATIVGEEEVVSPQAWYTAQVGDSRSHVVMFLQNDGSKGIGRQTRTHIKRRHMGIDDSQTCFVEAGDEHTGAAGARQVSVTVPMPGLGANYDLKRDVFESVVAVLNQDGLTTGGDGCDGSPGSAALVQASTGGERIAKKGYEVVVHKSRARNFKAIGDAVNLGEHCRIDTLEKVYGFPDKTHEVGTRGILL